ncbi:hypothetical protein AAVH_11096 [Aphelenchoides avenae]|nr:hypothetical protein AAVH_11096 [Aphelenchus avenae]
MVAFSDNEWLEVLQFSSRWDLDKVALGAGYFDRFKRRLTQKRVFKFVRIAAKNRRWPPTLPDDDCFVVFAWQKWVNRTFELRSTSLTIQQALEHVMSKARNDDHFEAIILDATFGQDMHQSVFGPAPTARDCKELFAMLQGISVDHLYLRIDEFTGEQYKQLKVLARKGVRGTFQWYNEKFRDMDKVSILGNGRGRRGM